MIDEKNQNIIEQFTLRKLDYARDLLKSVELPYSGKRSNVRERLTKALEDGLILVSTLQVLLDELDAWGDQRIQLMRLPASMLTEFQSADAVARKAAGTNMSHLLQGTIALTPPLELTPMRVAHEESSSQKRLKLVAAKIRQIMIPQPDISDHSDDQYPGVVFKPFKVEVQKAIAFAEIDLDTGSAIVSTTLLRQGQGYKAEFEEFFTVFQPFIALLDSDPIPLLDATHQICQLPSNEIRLVARQAKTAVGGKINYRSHSPRADMRSDPELDRSQAILPNAPGLHCNCFWEPVNGLRERIHTHIFAPAGEVSILGQTREASARYVLRRILEIN